MTEEEESKREILEGAAALFNDRGLHFTMDDLAASLHMSKKTIYRIIPDKRTLFNEIVEYAFASIHDAKLMASSEEELTTTEKLKKTLGILPEQLKGVDLRRLYELKEKYPETYSLVEQHLESGWEETTALMEKGMAEGTVRRVSIPIFRSIFQGALEQFFQRDVLMRTGISYNEALDEVVDILLEGIIVRKTAPQEADDPGQKKSRRRKKGEQACE